MKDVDIKHINLDEAWDYNFKKPWKQREPNFLPTWFVEQIDDFLAGKPLRPRSFGFPYDKQFERVLTWIIFGTSSTIMCRILAYCSREHQMQDWPNHKKLCKIIADEDKYLDFKVTNQAELKKYKEQRGLLWALKLGRKLTKFESQMFMFPRICAVCYNREVIIDCPKCFSEFYCSKEHQQIHSEVHEIFCKDLKLSLDLECYFYYNDADLIVFTMKRVKEQLKSMPESLDFINYVLKSLVHPTELDYINSCDLMLSGITILFALEKGRVLINRKLSKSNLEIHMVGASSFEYLMNWVYILEIYCHWIKNLEEIHIVFIGPEVTDYTLNFQLFKTQFCRNCQKRKNLVIKDASLFQCLYHEKIEFLEKPDIVVAFNSGLHEFAENDNDSWKDSLSSLIHYPEVPLLLTAYTSEELDRDVERITGIANIDIIYGPKRNPFSNLRPLQDWETLNIYYVNQFMTVIKKKC